MNSSTPSNTWDCMIQSLKDLLKNGEKNIPISEVTWNLLETGLTLRKALGAEINPSKKISLNNTLKAESLTGIFDAQGKEAQMHLLKEKIDQCPVCLAQLKPGKHLVFGEGSLDADIFFCGEAPGAEEETQGRPFVGPAGQLLTKMILAMGLQRENVYIANILKWRPSMPTPFGNRPPTSQEMEFCLPYLRAQLQIVQPKIIVALGSTAMNGLLGDNPQRKITEARGQWHSFENIPLILTYHPSYLLRNATHTTKREAWVDLLSVMNRLDLPISERQRNFFLMPLNS